MIESSRSSADPQRPGPAHSKSGDAVVGQPVGCRVDRELTVLESRQTAQRPDPQNAVSILLYCGHCIARKTVFDAVGGYTSRENSAQAVWSPGPKISRSIFAQRP